MIATILVKTIRPNAPYYTVKDHDERLGGAYWMFVTPIIEVGNRPSYFVTKDASGKFSLTGEGYIVDNSDALRKHKEDFKRRLAANPEKVRYRWDAACYTPFLIDTDDDGNRQKLFIIDNEWLDEYYPGVSKDDLRSLPWGDQHIICTRAREYGKVVYEEVREKC